MRNQFSRTIVTGLLAASWCASIAGAQAPAPAQAPPAATGTSAVANPTYVSILMEVNVNRPAAEVWKRVGKYCDIGEWLRIPNCTITAGKDGEVGAVRSVVSEVLVGKTELSYTYTQPVRAGRPYDLYHGTLEARPVTATTSKLVYTLMFDNSMLADDAAREADKARRNDAIYAGAREYENSCRRRHSPARTASWRSWDASSGRRRTPSGWSQVALNFNGIAKNGLAADCCNPRLMKGLCLSCPDARPEAAESQQVAGYEADEQRTGRPAEEHRGRVGCTRRSCPVLHRDPRGRRTTEASSPGKSFHPSPPHLQGSGSSYYSRSYHGAPSRSSSCFSVL